MSASMDFEIQTYPAFKTTNLPPWKKSKVESRLVSTDFKIVKYAAFHDQAGITSEDSLIEISAICAQAKLATNSCRCSAIVKKKLYFG